MLKLAIWVLYIMSWILDKYPSEESLILLCAACMKVRVLIQAFKLESKIWCVTVSVVKLFVGNGF